MGAGIGETTTFNLNWIDGSPGGAEIPLDTGSYGGWQLVGGMLSPSGSTVTAVLRILATDNDVDEPVGVHLDDVSLLWYPGEPDS